MCSTHAALDRMIPTAAADRLTGPNKPTCEQEADQHSAAVPPCMHLGRHLEHLAGCQAASMGSVCQAATLSERCISPHTEQMGAGQRHQKHCQFSVDLEAPGPDTQLLGPCRCSWQLTSPGWHLLQLG